MRQIRVGFEMVYDCPQPTPMILNLHVHSTRVLFLLGSRYCETDRLSETAWGLFGNGPTGWGRVQAICDFVHHHIQFGYEHARGRDAADVALNNTFGQNTLISFKVWTDEVGGRIA